MLCMLLKMQVPCYLIALTLLSCGKRLCRDMSRALQPDCRGFESTSSPSAATFVAHPQLSLRKASGNYLIHLIPTAGGVKANEPASEQRTIIITGKHIKLAPPLPECLEPPYDVSPPNVWSSSHASLQTPGSTVLTFQLNSHHQILAQSSDYHYQPYPEDPWAAGPRYSTVLHVCSLATIRSGEVSSFQFHC